MSPELFIYYSELILRNLEQERGLKVGGHNITNIRYADDTILIAELEKDLHRLWMLSSEKVTREDYH